jgi:uncharacterized protein YcbX
MNGLEAGFTVLPGVRASHFNLYAVKSAGSTTSNGASLPSLEVAPTGPVYDGVPDRWAVVGAETDAEGRQANLVSQRGWGVDGRSVDYPGDSQLATVRTNIVGPGRFDVHIPRQEPLRVNVAHTDPDAPRWDVQIHKGTYQAVDLGALAAEQLSDFLHAANVEAGSKAPRRKLRLFGAPLGQPREVRPEYQQPGASKTLYGADGTALLVVNNDTLEYMRAHHGMPDKDVEEARARANIILTGLTPFAEDRIQELLIGDGLRLRAVGPCGRCVMTGVNQGTGERDDNRFLGLLARAKRLGWSAATGERNAFYGVGFQPAPWREGTPQIRLGDRVSVIWNEESNILTTKPVLTGGTR